MVVNVCDHQHNGIGHYSRDKVAIVTKDLGYTNKVLLLFWVFRNNDSNCRSSIKSLLGFLLQSFLFLCTSYLPFLYSSEHYTNKYTAFFRENSICVSHYKEHVYSKLALRIHPIVMLLFNVL